MPPQKMVEAFLGRKPSPDAFFPTVLPARSFSSALGPTKAHSNSPAVFAFARHS